ncbi:MAG: hypothetical protein HQ582_22790, partial [Planctomycetes bacterium]|nr:hypothetical protein [Planctomycetota bacterium]
MIHARLLEELNWVARRYRRMYAWRALAFVWTAALLLGGGLFAFAWHAGWAASNAAPWFVVLVLLATGMSLGLAFRSARGLRWVARRIESQHPDLQHRLLAAVEQRPDLPDGRFGFLQETVLREALAHSHSHDWEETVPERQIRAAQLTGLTALALLALLSGAMLGYTGRHETAADLPPDLASPPELAQYEITIAPGDTSIERGTSLIVTARFGGNLPDDATLVCRPAGGEPSREAMSLSLSDPMFGGRVARVESDLTHQVEYAGRATRGYRVTVFDYPRLDRADAELVFPNYTSLEPKRVDDARRLTAVEGAKLTLFCHLNKPVKEAHLVDEDDVRIELTPGADDPNVYSFTKTLAQSAHYRLHLLDAEGRKNRTPPEFVFNVTPNRRPDLEIAAPARDVRVSPLEELQTKASVWDDFGLRAYGIAFGIAGRPSSDAVLGQTTTRNQRQPVEHLIDFEHLQAEPDQLLSYYFWAEDVGPDGNPRRTSGDIYFAEVRHFEEIFRQGDQPPSGESDQQQQGGQNEQQAQQLAELQKQIINATWTVIRREVSATPTGRFADDVDQLHQSQQAAIDQATALGEELRDPQSKEHLAAVLDHMTEAATSLNQA